ncbi:hypothetical protein PUR29_35000 [Methylobacterium ajmalii]|uniref:Uncharacterized protein n=1 Tax=Methylobacterium ajmalii TaxID=2738439 RepID=A0ABV0A492_9HYPH
MKYIWEPCDIRVGRRLRASSGSETWMIGYDGTSEAKHNLILVSLADGMISLSGQCYESMAIALNDRKMRPADIRLDDDQNVEVLLEGDQRRLP